MKVVIKNIISFILPVTVLILVPRWIEPDWTAHSNINLAIGIALGIIGLMVMTPTISSFIIIGKGTLAPWSTTQKLVITGLYKYVRNPMILGVLTVLIGEATMFSSLTILKWAGLFFVINTLYFKLAEEPSMVNRFGEDYIRYRKNVGMWLPRFTPYTDESSNSKKKEVTS